MMIELIALGLHPSSHSVWLGFPVSALVWTRNINRVRFGSGQQKMSDPFTTNDTACRLWSF